MFHHLNRHNPLHLISNQSLKKQQQQLSSSLTSHHHKSPHLPFTCFHKHTFNPKLDELSLSFIKSQSQMGNGRRRRQQVIHSLFNIVTFFVLAASVLPMFRILAEGRRTPSQLGLPQGMGEEEARIMRSQIGSRPPRCKGRCYSCGHCEAIQVPTNPQVAVAVAVKKLARAGVSSTTTAYSRGDYGSNYKPMSWKCKCGNSIFNP